MCPVEPLLTPCIHKGGPALWRPLKIGLVIALIWGSPSGAQQDGISDTFKSNQSDQQIIRLEREPAPSRASLSALARVPEAVQITLLVQDLTTGKVRESQGSLTPMIPASTTKMITAAAVVADLQGIGGWWSTELTVPRSEVGQSAVSLLTLQGSGDPTLSLSGEQNSIRLLAQQAAAHGLTRVGQVEVQQTVDPDSWKEAVIDTPMTAFMPQEWLAQRPATVEEMQGALHHALVAELRAAGITVEDDTPSITPLADLSTGTSDTSEGIASVQSPAPARILAETLRPSDNLLAEELLTSVAAQPDGTGTLQAAGERAIRLLEDWGVDTRQLHLADGSGLSRDTRLTARALVDLLDVMYRTGGTGQTYADPLQVFLQGDNPYAEALAHAGEGEDKYSRGGTLFARLRGSGLDVRAKTGTLPGVSALSGYVVGQSGHPLAFAVLMNGPEDSPILELRAAQDEWVQAIAAQY